ncbi:glycoside hydrolase family 43 protein [Sinomicrobium weinanense]|uniref:Family 43 glycosylhydrolase n=1 Tax=Sinomicrobium weinanense TaxID=2842200 RepID=A0A926JTA5_9FLAO|nr:glycoside hydrolase family 43 protein [Sinomicrobium weinanense]MBC9797132.1 family 43 glycosylhydrolase [Sinomicrobium weinanense]MBU3124833.1 glycoside hydrolase family 43 protein [Sinomicrobium weinanense]
MRSYFNILFFFLSGFAACQEPASPKPGEGHQLFTNPVVARNFPDPTVIKAHDGFYYAYATNTTVNGETLNIQVLKSKDLLHWQACGDALPEKPHWASSDFWAPHVIYRESKGKYYLYYSGESVADDTGKCLGVAVSDTPEGPFTDKGEPLLCGKGFVNIDPMVFQDPGSGKIFLYWGSGFESIKVRELSDDMLDFKANSATTALVHPVKNNDQHNYEKLVEGVWVTKHKNFYYLFYSGDNCCGENAHYAVMVARSKHPAGPFEKYKNAQGTPVILHQNHKWLAPGHNSVIADDSGRHWIMYHAINRQSPEKGRLFLMDRLIYSNGWPEIKGGSPSIDQIKTPLIKQ